jgi:hypothetical protein
LNRKDYLKSAQKPEQKTIKTVSVKTKLRKNSFGLWPLAAHGPFWPRRALCGG